MTNDKTQKQMKNKLLVWLFIGIFLLSFVPLVSAIETTTIDGKPYIVIPEISIWDRMFPQGQGFSIVGIANSASKYSNYISGASPSQVKYTNAGGSNSGYWKVSNNNVLNFNKGETQSMCGGKSGIYNIYQSSGSELWAHAVLEEIDNMQVACMNSAGCIAELYCMPYQYPPSDYICSNWKSGSKVATSSEEDSGIPLYQVTFSNDGLSITLDKLNSWKYCTSDACTGKTPLKCFKIADGSCISNSFPCTYDGYADGCGDGIPTWPYSTLSECNGDIDDGGDDPVNPGDAPDCKAEEKTFYSDGEVIISKKHFYIIYGSSSTNQAQAAVLNEYIPGFSSKYFEEISDGCCGDLKAVFDSEKTINFQSSSSILGLWNEKESVAGTYSVYKCVPSDEAGFCLDFAQKWFGSYTHTSCQNNSIIFIVLVLVGLIIVMRSMG